MLFPYGKMSPGIDPEIAVIFRLFQSAAVDEESALHKEKKPHIKVSYKCFFIKLSLVHVVSVMGRSIPDDPESKDRKAQIPL